VQMMVVGEFKWFDGRRGDAPEKEQFAELRFVVEEEEKARLALELEAAALRSKGFRND
jgi:hypothetical protein